MEQGWLFVGEFPLTESMITSVDAFRRNGMPNGKLQHSRRDQDGVHMILHRLWTSE